MYSLHFTVLCKKKCIFSRWRLGNKGIRSKRCSDAFHEWTVSPSRGSPSINIKWCNVTYWATTIIRWHRCKGGHWLRTLSSQLSSQVNCSPARWLSSAIRINATARCCSFVSAVFARKRQKEWYRRNCESFVRPCGVVRGVRPRPPTAFKFLVEHNNLSGNWVLGWAAPRNYKHWDLQWQQTPSATHNLKVLRFLWLFMNVDILTWHTKFKEYAHDDAVVYIYLENILFLIIPGFSLSFTEEHTTLRPSMSMAWSMELGMAGSLWQCPAPCQCVTLSRGSWQLTADLPVTLWTSVKTVKL